MSNKTVIPFGPQHPVLPEPIHLKLVVEDEIVKEAIPALGYVHRGLEMLAAKRDFHQMINVCERGVRHLFDDSRHLFFPIH